MKRNLVPLSLLTAGLVLLHSVPVFSQQQVASVLRSGDAPGVEAKRAAALTAGEYQAEVSTLRKRKAA